MVNPAPTELSERELEILRLVATGASNKEIASQLFISSNTVKVHLRNIFTKIGTASRTEAAMYAVRIGLVKTALGQLPVEEPSASLAPAFEEAQPLTLQQPDAPRRTWPRWAIVLLIPVVILGISLAFVLGRGSTPTSAFTTSTPLPPTPTSFPRWQVLSPLPVARRGLALAAFENYLYAIGGETSLGITGSLEHYNVGTNTWSALAPKPIPVTDAQAAIINGLIYMPGGRTGPAPTQLTDRLEIYDPTLDQWQPGASLPIPLSAYALQAFEGKLYLFGGWDGKAYLSTVYVYDTSLDTWQSRTPMPTARAFSGATAAGGKIYVIGGTAGDLPLDVNEIYSPARDTEAGDPPWETGFPLPDSRLGFQVTTIADAIYVLGGASQAGNRFGLIYFPSTSTWQSLEASPQPLGSYFGLTSIGPQLFIVGGEVDSVLSDQNLAYQALITFSIPIIIK